MVQLIKLTSIKKQIKIVTGSSRGITFNSLDTFLRAFIPGKQIYFQIRGLKFIYGDGFRKSIIQFVFYGGSVNGMKKHKLQTIKIDLDLPLYDAIQFLATRDWFVDTKPKTFLFQFDFLQCFIRWHVNFGKRFDYATELEKIAESMFNRFVMEQRRMHQLDGVPFRHRRKWGTRADYFAVKKRAKLSQLQGLPRSE